MSYKCQKLTQSISFNNCYTLSLTIKRNKSQPKCKKKYICIIGRQHPCQTVSSFVVEGILDFLTSGNQEAEELLKKYIFKIVPMMNPDGVIYGNSRCDISGSDINRQWSFPSRSLYPTVEACKNMMFRLGITGHDIQYFFDVHGHSKQLNSFMYGPEISSQQVSLRLLPYIMSKLNSDFVFSSCEFGLSIFKRKTARANVYRIMKFSHRSFTIETSGYGYGNYYNSQHFTSKKLKYIGHTMMLALFFEKFQPQQNKEGIIMNQIEQDIASLLKQKKERTERMKKTEVVDDERQKQESVKSGSDSEPSVGELGIEEKQMIFLPHSLALELKEAARLEDVEKQKQQKRDKRLTKSMSKQSHNATQKSRKIVLQKLKLTNPVPFVLSQPRVKVPKPKKIEIEKIPVRGGTVPLSQIPMVVDLPQHPFKDNRRNKQSLTQTIKKLERKSFFQNFRKEIDDALDNKRHHRYSQNSKEPIRLKQQIPTVQTLEMKSYDSVDQLHEKRLSSLIEKSRRTERLLIEKLQKSNWLSKNRSNRKL